MPILALVANPQAPIARQVPRLDFLPKVDRRDLQKIFKEAIATRTPEALEAAWDALEAIARQDYPELLEPASVLPMAAPQIIRVVQRKLVRTAIPIDRASPLGNPFVMRSEKDRDLVCDLYSIYFFAVLSGEDPYEVVQRLAQKAPISDAWKRQTEKSFRAALQDLLIALHKGSVNLGCHCSPKRCHGDTIKVFLEEQLVTNESNLPVEQRVLEVTGKERLGAIAASAGGLSSLLPQLSAKARLHYITHTR